MVYDIDGARFSTLEEFFDEVSAVMLNRSDWGRNLDAFNDILRGGFGAPAGGFTIRWRNHDLSRQRLGHAETAKQLERRLRDCHPSNLNIIKTQLAEARAGRGLTVFDWLVDIIRSHGPGGAEPADGVELVLA